MRPYAVAFLMSSTTSTGRRITAIPAAANAAIFSSAVPLEPEMIALPDGSSARCLLYDETVTAEEAAG